jgi:hypothetical protein
MRRLAMTLASLTMIAGLAAPAWACDGNGNAGPPRRFHSASNDRPGEGRAHYDREHHDNPAL